MARVESDTMKPFPALLLFATSLAAHDVTPSDREALRAHILDEWKRERGMTEVASVTSSLQITAAFAANAANAPQAAKAFLPFTKLDLRADGEFLYVGSNGLPDHNMMVGITAWQQQVPLPQAYFGDNAWRIPLNPVPAREPAMIRGRFLRGAIALAVNGIPIFNPQNNRGEISYEIGELDEWGGHCGRADDYHYHVAPLHLQALVGKAMPVAYALDGYPIYGLTEPDGTPVQNLDVCHGHDHDGLGYHYHASMKYPYVFAGFHGEVVEREDQIDPQPRAQGVREALTALRGAKITAFESTGKDSYKLSYEVNGDKRSVSYSIKADGTYPFHFDKGREGQADEIYTARRQGGGVGGRPPSGGGPEDMRGKGGREGEPRRADPPPPRPSKEGVRPPRPLAGVEGILDGNGDGVVTAQEFADNAKSSASRKGIPLDEAMAKAKAAFAAMDKDRSGQLEIREWQETFGGVPVPMPPQKEDRPEEDRPRRGGEGEPRRPKGGQGSAPGRRDSFVERPDQPRSSDGKFLLTSPVVEDLAAIPRDATGDGEDLTLPLSWKAAPAGTQCYALIMDHSDKEGNMKWYWILYDIPASVTVLPKNAQGLGRLGTGFKGRVGYEPPMSKGAGSHTYVLTMYALRAPLEVAGTPGREELLAAMQGKVLASSSLRVVHVSSGAGNVRSENPETPPAPQPTQAPGKNSEGRKGGGKGGPPGLIKPSIADTMKLNIYADNWFMLYINGRLVALDNTVIFRTRIETPGWTPRWNTKPDLDVSGAPNR